VRWRRLGCGAMLAPMPSLLERLARSAAIEVQDEEHGLRIKCPDRQTQGRALFGLGLVGIVFLLIGHSAIRIDWLVGAGLVCALLIAVGIAKFFNALIIEVGPQELVLKKHPLPLGRTQRFARDKIAGFAVEAYAREGTSRGSSNFLYALTMYYGSGGSKRIAYFGESEQDAEYVKRLLSQHLEVA